jgi:hypothetical protein
LPSRLRLPSLPSHRYSLWPRRTNAERLRSKFGLTVGHKGARRPSFVGARANCHEDRSRR